SKGFSTIHIASINGRLNILRFLIEEKSVDPNFSSHHGWRAVHLCINNQIGDRAANCLRYLVEKGADINM
ncbi:MAG: ankyrin repeat domain-containing protein, partial [Leptolyngbyaceae cyanobacterium SM1_3_5]|nr:ankyrin repeat domain-containing protein [Leptolyngbyaceae cyanobacterium SM1_3_5]